MVERKSIFSQAKITSAGESISETLLNSNNENKINDNDLETKIVKITKNSQKKHINLTLKENVIIKIKNIAKNNNMSVSTLLEIIIDQL